jgi:spore germination protein GerM
VSRKQISRTITKNDSPLTGNIQLLLAGPNASERSKGCRSLIPDGTRLLSASVRDGVALLNFSEEFEYNRVGVEGYLGQLMQIVYTATEFSTVNSVQFLIDGQKKEYLGSEGVWIGSPLSRSSF